MTAGNHWIANARLAFICWALIGVGLTTGPTWISGAGVIGIAAVVVPHLYRYARRLEFPGIRAISSRISPAAIVAASLFASMFLIDSGYEPAVVAGTAAFIVTVAVIALVLARLALRGIVATAMAGYRTIAHGPADSALAIAFASTCGYLRSFLRATPSNRRPAMVPDGDTSRSA